MPKTFVHACKSLEQEAQAAPCLEKSGGLGPLMLTELPDFSDGDLTRVVLNLASNIDQLGLELPQIGKSRLVSIILRLVDKLAQVFV